VREVEGDNAKVKAEITPARCPRSSTTNQRRLERVYNELAGAQRNLDEATSDEQFFSGQLASVKAMGGANDDASPGRRLEMLKPRSLRVHLARLQRGKAPRHRAHGARRSRCSRRR
jgi:hypothetical protein